MPKNQDFAVLMANLTSKTIIAANQGKTLPAYPFITWQSIDEDTDNLSVIKSETINGGLDITETKTKRVVDSIQFDIYDETLIGVINQAKSFINDVDFKYRREILDAGFGIVEIGNVIDNTSLESVKARYRKTLTIVIDYSETFVRSIENMQSMKFQLDENNLETITR